MDILKEQIIINKKENNDAFHIVFGIDDIFIRPLGVLITSIMQNNKKENIVFHIISKQIENKNRSLLENFAKQYNTSIYLHIINEYNFNDLPCTEYISHATYNRFLIADILKDITDKVLYLDADIICLKSINELKRINIENVVAGVIEESNDYVVQQQIKALSLNSNKYFNAGVLYINIKNWLKYDINNKLIDLIKSGNKYMFNDQDMLNIVLEKNSIYLGKKYNYTFDVRYKKNRYIYNIPKDTVFLHYVGKFKPWQEWCMHPIKKYFLEYAKQSLWNDIPLDKPNTYKQMKHMAKSYMIYNHRLKAMYWYFKYALTKIKSKL